jgi:serine/threonine-protein kinase RIO1
MQARTFARQEARAIARAMICGCSLPKPARLLTDVTVEQVVTVVTVVTVPLSSTTVPR